MTNPIRTLHDIEEDHFFRHRRKKWHLPRVYRYRVATTRRFCPHLNRYPHHVIGAAVVVGRWAYCVKWASL